MAVRNQHVESNIDVRRTALLGVGDVAMMVAFAALGRRSHGEAAGLDAIAQVLETAAPFAISWLVIAPFVGAYRNDVLAQPKSLAGRTVAAWALALFPGIALRTVIRQSAFPAISFAITTFLVVSVLLLAWRFLFFWLIRRGSGHGN